MAADEARHLQSMERARLTAEYSERRIGQMFGITIGVAALSGSVACAWLGHPATAGVLGSSTVLGLVTIFVYGRTKVQRAQTPR
jgi:uncharacterized membrane protein